MLKNLLLILFLILLVVLSTTSGVLGYLYVTKNTEYNKLLSESLNTNQKTIEEVAVTPVDKSITYVDTALEIEITYPSSWQLAANTEITEDFAYEPIYGRIIQNYEIRLIKSSSVLTFTKILGAVDGFPNPLDKGLIDYVQLNSELIRYKFKTESSWRYVSILECSDYVEYLGEEAAASELCVSPFYPGFGVFANTATLTASSESDITEADQIVISALN